MSNSGLSGSWSMLTLTGTKCMMGNSPLSVDLDLINIVYLQFDHIQSLTVHVVVYHDVSK